MFYVDWDEAKRMPRFLMPAEREQLTYNIKRVKETLKKFDFI